MLYKVRAELAESRHQPYVLKRSVYILVDVVHHFYFII